MTKKKLFLIEITAIIVVVGMFILLSLSGFDFNKQPRLSVIPNVKSHNISMHGDLSHHIHQ